MLPSAQGPNASIGPGSAPQLVLVRCGAGVGAGTVHRSAQGPTRPSVMDLAVLSAWNRSWTR